MTVRHPILERPTEAEGPTSPEVLFKEARRRRRRRWAVFVAGLAVAAVITGVAYGVSGNSPSEKQAARPPGSPITIGTTWHSDGTAIFDHSGAGDYSGFTPTTTITCAGPSATTCYLTVHANGVLPNGELSRPGKWGAFATAFVASEFASTTQGRTWRSIELPDKAWTSTAFSCPTSRDCAVGALVGAHGGTVHSFIRPTAVVVITRDGGRTWALRHLPASAGLVRQLDCVTTESCVAVTWMSTATRVGGMMPYDGAGRVSPTEVYTTQDAGRTWSAVRMTKPPAGDVYSLGPLTCPTAARCLLTGRRIHVEVAPGYTSINHVHTYLMTGAKAVVVTLDTRARTASVEVHRSGPVSCVSENHCLMVTTVPRPRGSPLTVLLASTDGGRSWLKVLEHGIPRYSLSLACVSATSCILTTGTTTNDGGRDWLPTMANVVHVSCTTSGDCVGLQATDVRDPHVPTGYTPATRVVTNAPR